MASPPYFGDGNAPRGSDGESIVLAKILGVRLGGASGSSEPAGNAITAPGDGATLWAWFLVDAETAYADASPISQLTDFSGRGNHVANTGANRPTYYADIINGLPGAFFEGTTTRLTKASVDDGTPSATAGLRGGTMFVVGSVEAATNFGQFVSVRNTGSLTYFELRQRTTTGRAEATYYTGLVAIVEPGNVQVGVPRLFVVRFGAAARMGAGIEVDLHEGTQLLAASSDTAGSYLSSVDWTTLDLGSRGTSLYLNGLIGEVLIYQGCLTIAQMTPIVSYLSEKWFTNALISAPPPPMPFPGGPPGPPRSLVATIGSGNYNCEIDWINDEGGGQDIIQVWTSTDGVNFSVYQDLNGSLETYNFGVLTDQLAIKVRAGNNRGYSEFTDTQYSRPEPPVITAVNEGATNVFSVDWTYPLMAGIISFDLQRQVDGGGWTSIYSPDTGDISYTDDVDGVGGNLYEYRIRALHVDAATYSTFSNIGSV